MSGHSLPDEIISEILSPALKVPDELFSDNGNVSPFAKYSESTSAYLLVCKSWLRVATPLLYNTVVLRSKAQAKALSVALSGNEELGQFIKKLRVEGGYGLPMHIILKSSPNISDLFLSLEIFSSDNTNGLCKGLSLISPARLILRDLSHNPLENKILSQLVEALIKSMSKWQRLRSFDSPYSTESTRANKILQSLVKSNTLDSLAIPNARNLSWVYSTLKGCPLKVINIKQPVTRVKLREFERDPVLKALLKFTEASAAGKVMALDPILNLHPVTPSLNPLFIPMADAPKDVRDKIWARVLYFAMSVPELAIDPTSKDVPRRLPLLLVSKTFNRLGLPSYYAHVAFSLSSYIPKFAFILSNNPSVGPHVRSLVMKYWEFAHQVTRDKIDSTILSQTSGLVRFTLNHGFSGDHYALIEAAISREAFETLVKSSGSTLQEFSVLVRTKEEASATIFSNLTALRTLEWKCLMTFSSTNVPENGLENLEELKISSTSQTFLTVLSLMKLKYLRNVVLPTRTLDPEKFLKAHGFKLTALSIPLKKLETLKIFELCPNLCSLSLLAMFNPPAADVLLSPQAVPSLLKITLDPESWTKGVPIYCCQCRLKLHFRDKDRTASWEKFFLDFQPKCLPNLHEIQVKCLVWPTTERDITKSCWVRWAELLLKRDTMIGLTDKTGAKWRPRLKVK
ncbi:hypothetical protein K438DRAFT_1810857 [Mycena galopus ATCC 62051]|nr:hypothetical protein K438DRAFT_1810857 [Mycena galopus ATCC 62051]